MDNWILHYEVLSKLGEGGMGVVYRARDSRLGRIVALKVLPAEKSGDPKRRQRFLHEARAAAALNHPNIVCVYDIGTDQGVDFIAMEFVAGASLDEIMKSGRLLMHDVLSFSSQIAAALAKAHSAGVVHRDLKPANIMITDERCVKLLDFGLAQLNPMLAVDPRSPGSQAETESAITEFGTRIGTIQYMSPEQARGEVVDERSDIFSFGLVLYEIAAGAKPFPAGSTLGVLHAIAYEEPVPIDKIRVEIPPRLGQIISKCMQKDKASRYQSMQAVEGELRQLSVNYSGASDLSGAVPRTLPQRNWKPVMWKISALLAAGLVFALSPVGRRSWHELRATRFAESIHLPVEAAEQCRRGHIYLLRYDKAGNVDKAIEYFQKALQQDHDNSAAYAGLGEAYAFKHNENNDAQWLRLAIDNAKRALQLGALLAEAHVSMGFAFSEALDYPGAEREFRRALELGPTNADAMLLLGDCLNRQHRPKEAEEAYHTLIQKYPNDWRPYHYLGGLLYRTGRYKEAVDVFGKANSLAPDNASILRLLGLSYHQLDRDAEATEALQKALAIRPNASIYTNLGAVFFYQGRYLDALSAFQSALSNGANQFGNWSNLGDAYRFTPGNETKAKDMYAHALRLVEEQLGNAPDDSTLRTNLAVLLAKSGQRQRAELEIHKVENSTKLDAESLFQLAVASEMTGERLSALDLLRRAVRSGYGLRRIQNDPDLVALRRDPGYRQLVLAPIKKAELHEH